MSDRFTITIKCQGFFIVRISDSSFTAERHSSDGKTPWERLIDRRRRCQPNIRYISHRSLRFVPCSFLRRLQKTVPFVIGSNERFPKSRLKFTNLSKMRLCNLRCDFNPIAIRWWGEVSGCMPNHRKLRDFVINLHSTCLRLNGCCAVERWG